MPVATKSKKSPWYVVALFILVLILLSPIILLIALVLIVPWLKIRFIQRPRLLRRVKNEWLPQGKFILFVYSDNELWKKYAEENIIPKISQNAIILNWSLRKDWIKSDSLEAQLFRNLQWVRERIWQQNIRMGGQEYNHLAIVFKPWDKPKKISFWRAFKDYEFGRDGKLKSVENELYACL